MIIDNIRWDPIRSLFPVIKIICRNTTAYTTAFPRVVPGVSLVEQLGDTPWQQLGIAPAWNLAWHISWSWCRGWCSAWISYTTAFPRVVPGLGLVEQLGNTPWQHLGNIPGWNLVWYVAWCRGWCRAWILVCSALTSSD